jgi:hypothetical protein
VNPVPIALAFALSLVLFASWVLFMTRELWWSTVEPTYLQILDALAPARAELARLGPALRRASVKAAHELAHKFTAWASRPRSAPNSWWRVAGWPHGWGPPR